MAYSLCGVGCVASYPRPVLPAIATPLLCRHTSPYRCFDPKPPTQLFAPPCSLPGRFDDYAPLHPCNGHCCCCYRQSRLFVQTPPLCSARARCRALIGGLKGAGVAHTRYLAPIESCAETWAGQHGNGGRSCPQAAAVAQVWGAARDGRGADSPPSRLAAAHQVSTAVGVIGLDHLCVRRHACRRSLQRVTLHWSRCG